jgi:DNA-binding winged helix-turn-helix (wHTH) protein/tetratricopeptide (TPR) repeat protein
MLDNVKLMMYRFGSFVLDLERGALLTADGKELPLRPKSFALLQFLVENAGRLLSYDEIMAALWPDIYVSENNVTQCMSDVRRALGPEAQQTLRTVCRRGYLFTASVTQEQKTTRNPRVVDDSIAFKKQTDPQNPVPATPARGGPPHIAVLPFRLFDDTILPSHISDGITADITCQLAGLRELTVISHGSTHGFRDPALDPREVGRGLGAQYLVLGSIRRSGDRLRLNTELTEAETGQIIYTRADDAEAALSFADQDRIVAQLVNRLVPQVRETELRRIRGKRPEVLTVYEKVLLAREHIARLERKSFDTARTLLDEIITEDPGYGEAYALAADWHGISMAEGWSNDHAADVAAVEHLTRTALHLDSGNVRALTAYAHRRSLLYRDHAGAMELFGKALDTAPSSAMTWALSGCCLAFAGDGAESVRRAFWALQLSPRDREAHKFFYVLCVAHYTQGDYERAAEWGLKAIDEDTVWQAAGGFTAASLAALGRHREAREVANQTMIWAPKRRVRRTVASLAYRDPRRRELYGQHLRAAGFPD